VVDFFVIFKIVLLMHVQCTIAC